MSKSLADLRSKPPTARPERVMNVCLAPDLFAEVQRLRAELEKIEVAEMDEADARAEVESEEDAKPRRLGEKRPEPEPPTLNPEGVALRKKILALLEEMNEHDGEVTLRANLTNGEWRIFCNENPARAQDEPGHDRDKLVTFGYCNADALIDSLDKYAHLWNGERLADGDWATLFAPVIPAKFENDMATTVVGMYQTGADFSEWRNGLSANLKRSIDSAPPQPSGSATASSTAASPDSSTAPTT